MAILPDELDELEALAARASEWPWDWDPSSSMIEGGNGGAVAYIAEHGNMRTIIEHREDFSSADARYIARMHPGTTLRLIEEIRRLNQLLDVALGAL